MYLFKTSGNTFDSVIKNQKHAFNSKPKNWYPGEIVLVSKNKLDCKPGEKQIQFTMRLVNIRLALQNEIETYWPGNTGRWDYLVECSTTEPISVPFNLEDILGPKADVYRSIMTFRKIDLDHEKMITPFLMSSSTNII